MKYLTLILLIGLFGSSAHAKYWTPAKGGTATCEGAHPGSHNCTDAQAQNGNPPGPGYICCSYTNNPNEHVIFVPANRPPIREAVKVKKNSSL